ncbi:MAG: peptidase domain-containing ABC transporter [Turicibacter sp.]|nr:peptidase domain-containing ABC transporter [Turicibacter sp.]
MRNSKIKFVEQHEHSECGLACTTMLLNYMNIKTTLSDLRDKYGVPKGGNSLIDLRSVFDDFQVSTKAFRIDDVMALESNQSFPCIGFWRNSHFIILESIHDCKVKIVDPSIGKIVLGIEEFKENFSNVIMVANRTNNKEINIETTERNQALKNLVLQNKKMIFGLFGFSLLLQFFSLLNPILMQNIIDYRMETLGGLTSLVMVGVLSLVMFFLVQVGRNVLISKLQRKFTGTLMDEFMNNIFRMNLKFFTNRSTGDLIFKSNLIPYIQQILSNGLVTTVIDVVFAALYLAVMLFYSVHLTIYTLGISILMVLISIIQAKKHRTMNDKDITLQSNVQSVLTELYENIEAVKAMGMEDEFYSKWKNKFNSQQEISYQKNITNSWFGSFTGSIQFILPVSIMLFGLYLTNMNLTTIGTVVAFVAIATAFMQPISTIIGFYSQMLIVKSYYQKINEILNKTTDDTQEGAVEIENILPITINDVSFKHSHFENATVSNINLEINEKDKIAIVGTSGSGKSTLLKLIGRLYEPTFGEMEISGINSKEVNQKGFRKAISYVTQHVATFHATLLDNILLGQEIDDQEHLLTILDQTTVLEMALSLPLGLETMVSEAGMNFSGGQLQKIAIARGLVKKPQLILLDEPTSSLDNISEKKIMDYILKMDVPCVCIAHRLSTIKYFNKIVVMDNGQITEIGNHDELIASKGIYYNLYQGEG